MYKLHIDVAVSWRKLDPTNKIRDIDFMSKRADDIEISMERALGWALDQEVEFVISDVDKDPNAADIRVVFTDVTPAHAEEAGFSDLVTMLSAVIDETIDDAIGGAA